MLVARMIDSFFGVTLIFNFLLPLVVIYAIYRLLTNGNNKRPIVREVVVWTLALITGYVGVVSLFRLPEVFISDNESSVFAVRMIVGIGCLAAGAFVKELTGRLLMVVGLALVLIASPFIFQNFGDKATYALVLVSFAGLIGLIVYQHSRSEKEGSGSNG